MTKTDALKKIRYSLKTEEAKVITPKGETYDDYMQTLANILIDSVIEPIQVTVTSACAKEGDFETYKNAIVWGIAKKEGSWLLTLDNENEFALGFGEDPNNIMMHGFSSSDALGEWCV